MFCVYCGAKNPDDALFCKQCGRAMVGAKTPTVEPVAQQAPAFTSDFLPPPPTASSSTGKPSALSRGFKSARNIAIVLDVVAVGFQIANRQSGLSLQQIAVSFVVNLLIFWLVLGILATLFYWIFKRD